MADFPDGSQLEEIEALPKTARLLFATIICERLFPNFVRFSEETGWRGKADLREAQDLLWRCLRGNCDLQAAAAMASQVAAWAPDTESFRSDFTSAALDAVTAISEALEACRDPSAVRIANCGYLAYESARMYAAQRSVTGTDIDLSEEELNDHPVVRREIERQHDDILWIKSHWPLDASELDQLRREIRAQAGTGNLS